MEPRFDSQLQDALVKLLESGAAMAKTELINTPMAVAQLMNQMQKVALAQVDDEALVENFIKTVWN